MDVARTPDGRFDDLPGWPWEPRYVEQDGVRLACVDEGGGHPVVLLHGEPTWGFLYRTVIPPLLAAGLRVVVPDLPGFGRSDKPTERAWYTYDRLVDTFGAHLDAVGIDQPVTLVVHDWGGPIGLRWATEHPDRVAALVILNTLLYVPGGQPSPAWLRFRDHVAGASRLDVGELVRRATATGLTTPEVAAYDAPFTTDASQAGAMALPLLVPRADDDPGAAAMWRTAQSLGDWDRPTRVLWGADDPILTVEAGERFAARIPGASTLERLSPAAHMVQEDAGPAIGEAVVDLVAQVGGITA